MKEYFDIGVILPLEEELLQFQEHFDLVKNYSTDLSFRYSFNTESKDLTGIVFQQDRMGKTSAFRTAEAMLQTFDIGLLVCLGIAGSLSSDARIGDVCYSELIIDVYDNTKISERAGKTIHEFSPTYYKTDPRIVTALNFARTTPEIRPRYVAWQKKRLSYAKQLIPNSFTGRNGQETVETLTTQAGKIACAAVSKSPDYNDQLLKTERKILAIETESGGVFEAANKTLALAIRGISDYADMDKNRLEKETNGKARALAANNAASFLKFQLQNSILKKCLGSIKLAAQNSTPWQTVNLPEKSLGVPEMHDAVRAKIDSNLRELSPEYRLQKQGYVLPIPRLRLITNGETKSKEQRNNTLVDFREVVLANQTTFLEVNKNYPDKGLPWILAHDLLLAQKFDKQVIPVVVDSEEIRPPDHGLTWYWERRFHRFLQLREHVHVVYILTGMQSHSSTRATFLIEEIRKQENASFVFVITDMKDRMEASSRAGELIAAHCKLSQVSFREIARFLEANFQMPALEADVVAKRLRSVFEQYDLSAHPSYFAGIPIEVLSSLLHANRRAELISLAVAGFLSFVVAEDKEEVSLSRTTREVFLRKLIFEMKVKKQSYREPELIAFTSNFAEKNDFDIRPIAFINSFIEKGILYFNEGVVEFSMQFIESYLLAKELTLNPQEAEEYFSFTDENLDTVTFDLYAEMGPDPRVVKRAIDQLDSCNHDFSKSNLNKSVLFEIDGKYDVLLKSNYVERIQERLLSVAQKVKSGVDNREEKQRVLDISERINERALEKRRDVKARKGTEEFGIDSANVAVSTFVAAVMLLGSGSERLEGKTKQDLATRIVHLGANIVLFFTDMVKAVDFKSLRVEFTSRDFLDEILGPARTESIEIQQKKVISDLVSLIEFYLLSSPLKTVLGFIAENARGQVLSSSIRKAEFDPGLPSLIASSWLADIDSEKGKGMLLQQIKAMPAGVFVRIVLSMHLIHRVYWHKWRNEDRNALIEAAEAAFQSANLSLDKSAILKKLDSIEASQKK